MFVCFNAVQIYLLVCLSGMDKDLIPYFHLIFHLLVLFGMDI